MVIGLGKHWHWDISCIAATTYFTPKKTGNRRCCSMHAGIATIRSVALCPVPKTHTPPYSADYVAEDVAATWRERDRCFCVRAGGCRQQLCVSEWGVSQCGWKDASSPRCCVRSHPPTHQECALCQVSTWWSCILPGFSTFNLGGDMFVILQQESLIFRNLFSFTVVLQNDTIWYCYCCTMRCVGNCPGRRRNDTVLRVLQP